MDRKKLYAIVLAASITTAILVPVLIIFGPGGGPGPSQLGITILTPTNTTSTSQNPQIVINLNAQGDNLDTVWYRLYNETDGAWVDPNNITWMSSTARTLGQGGVYTLYAWVNDTTGTTLTDNVTFTMFHEIIYEGNTPFGADLTVGQYDLVFFRNGEFSIPTTDIFVYGSLDMQNISFTTNIQIHGGSAVTGSNITWNLAVYFSGDIVASLDNVTFTGQLRTYDNATMNITNLVMNTQFYSYDSSTVIMNNATTSALSIEENSTVSITNAAIGSGTTVSNLARFNLTYSTGSTISISDFSQVYLRNVTGSNNDLNVRNSSVVTIVNSSFRYIYNYTLLQTGNWQYVNNNLTGTGVGGIVDFTVINTQYAGLYTRFIVYGTTQFLVNNSNFYSIEMLDDSIITINQSSIVFATTWDRSNLSLYGSTMGTLDIRENSTIYLQDTSIPTYMRHYIEFDQGANVVAYNDTFTGADAWSAPNLTIGANVNINTHYYVYTTNNQVNLAVYNTTVYNFFVYDQSNITAHFCSTLYLNCYSNGNLTLYNSTATQIVGFFQNNITLFNSTVITITLYQYSFAWIADHSHVNTLNLYQSAGYYLAPDSTIG